MYSIVDLEVGEERRMEQFELTWVLDNDNATDFINMQGPRVLKIDFDSRVSIYDYMVNGQTSKYTLSLAQIYPKRNYRTENDTIRVIYLQIR
jgi:hypothetical protein